MTCYQQIVETVSPKKLSSNAQGMISKDQKHSSVVPRVDYQKQRWQEVAAKVHKYLETLHGEKGLVLQMDV